ncbi:MAG: hypothetical protein OEQ81_04635 [Flavobacteriaceae bacterium]|nr:hypothetical protein [Flavobacteriaceae bacterium]
MENRKLFLLGSLVIFIVALTLLFTGSPILDRSLSTTSNVPWGTWITWLGMIALPFSIYWSSKGLREPDTRLRKLLSNILKIIIILALLWAPICYLLAGNIAFNFSEVEGFQGGQTAMKWFWRYSYGIPIVTIGVLLLYWVSHFIKK